MSQNAPFLRRFLAQRFAQNRRLPNSLIRESCNLPVPLTFLLGTEKNTIDDAVAGAEGCTLHLDTDSSRQQRVESIGSIRLLEP